MTVTASTISGNTGASGGSGGIYSNAGTIRLGATIVAGNARGNCHAVTAGEIASAGYNLTNDKTGAACSFTAANDRVNKEPAPRAPRQQRRPDEYPAARRRRPG